MCQPRSVGRYYVGRLRFRDSAVLRGTVSKRSGFTASDPALPEMVRFPSHFVRFRFMRTAGSGEE